MHDCLVCPLAWVELSWVPPTTSLGFQGWFRVSLSLLQRGAPLRLLWGSPGQLGMKVKMLKYMTLCFNTEIPYFGETPAFMKNII